MEPARSVRPMAREGGEGPGQGKAAREGRRFVVSHCTCISRFLIFSPDFRPGRLTCKSKADVAVPFEPITWQTVWSHLGGRVMGDWCNQMYGSQKDD